MQRQLIVQGATRSKQNIEDMSFLQEHTRAVLHVSQDQTKRRDGKHTHISHANTGIKHNTLLRQQDTSQQSISLLNLIFNFVIICKLMYHYTNTK
jgi:hypothetical protein